MVEVWWRSGGYASLNKWVFNWLRKPGTVCCDWTDCGSVFHSVGGAIAKSHLPMTFVGQTEERNGQFPQVRLLVLIKVDGDIGWESLMVLNVMSYI